MLNPKDSYENMIKEFQILEHTDEDLHETNVTEENGTSLLKAEHIHDKHVAKTKIAVAGTQVTHEINDEGSAEIGAVPPPPSFTESDHRMSAMLFHAPPPPIEIEESDETVNMPFPDLPPMPPMEEAEESGDTVNMPPPGLPTMQEAVNLPPPSAPPGL